MRDRLGKILPLHSVADIELLASELVSNAVRHAHRDGEGTISLNIDIGPRTIRVSVVDGGAGFDATNLLRSPSADGGGWGLFIVEEMSDHWGIDRDPHSVWFEIHRD